MSVSKDAIVILWVLFGTLFFVALQQVFVQTLKQKDWLIYRLFIVLSVFNENIICLILFLVSFDTNDVDQNSGATMAIRALEWINLLMSSYIVYRLGMLVATWMYRQENKVMHTSPKNTHTNLAIGVVLVFFLFVVE